MRVAADVAKGKCWRCRVMLKTGLANLLALFFVHPMTMAGTMAGNVAQLSNLSHALSAPHSGATQITIGAQAVAASGARQANFEREPASPEARQVAAWVVSSEDNRNMPFVIVDKIDARVYVFHADGRLRGAAPALLGLARGDHAAPDIGNRKLSNIRPEERTTPAGRFVASLDRNLRGEEILWVDYEGAVSLHPVITTNPRERRAQRLATPTPRDNRISYGCINVPAGFYERVVSPAFTGTDGIVYVLPEIRALRDEFPLLR